LLKSLKWSLVLLVLAGTGVLLWIYSGAYDIGADVPHRPWTETLIEFALDRAVVAHAATVVVPSDLRDPARIRRGAGNYDAMCAQCHLKPGVADTELRRGLYPQPPDFTVADPDEPATARAPQNFWVIKHGIKMTAMPAWSAAGVDDQSIWDLVALIQVLPTLGDASYDELVESSPGHVHDHGEHDHGHANDTVEVPHDSGD
jgi:mono/diheme cytochrome c family protein